MARVRTALEDLNRILQDSADLLDDLKRACDIMERLSSEVGPGMPSRTLAERIADLTVTQQVIGFAAGVAIAAIVVLILASNGSEPRSPTVTPIRTTETPVPTQQETAMPPPPPTDPPRLPDLDISVSDQPDVTCDRLLAVTCTLPVQVEVNNSGEGDLAEPVDVRVALSNGVEFIETVEGIPAGQQFTVDATFQDNYSSCFSPRCEVQAGVNPDGRVAESDIRNNADGAVNSLPDVLVKDATELLEADDTVVRVTVTNSGSAPTSAFLDVTVQAVDSVATRQLGILEPGQELTIVISLEGSLGCPRSGCEFEVTLDGRHTIPESDEFNNRYRFTGLPIVF